MRKKLLFHNLRKAVFFFFTFFCSAYSFAQGQLDPSFGNGGLVTTNFGFGETQEAAYKMVVQPDGKIILAGGGNLFSRLARYNPDGTLDNTFGTGGKVNQRWDENTYFDQITDIILLPDGGILTAGIGRKVIGGVYSDYSFVTKFFANGSPDNSIRVQLYLGGQDHAISNSIGVQSDGKIIVATNGIFSQVTATLIGRLESGSSVSDFSFPYIIDNSISAEDLQILPNNDFLLGGSHTQDGFALTKYSAAGIKQGVTMYTNFNEGYAHAMSLQTDGKILLAGRTYVQGQNFDFAVARYNIDGSPDNSFDGDGKIITDLGGIIDDAQDIIIQPDGRIIVVGRKEVQDDTTFAAVRYLENGQLDPCFGKGGKLLIVFDRSGANTGALQPDGKIILAGYSNTDFALARFIPSDEGSTWYLDADNDGYSTGIPVKSCASPGSGYKQTITGENDCNDNDATMHPGATEVCDRKDNDCDGQIDEGFNPSTWYYDADGDGYGDNNSTLYPPIISCTDPSVPAITCPFYDPNYPIVCTPTPAIKYVITGGDCNDNNAAINPGAGTVEICDGIDNDCDGLIDEGCSGKPTISISAATVYESEGKAVITVKLSYITTLQVKINYTTSDGTAVSNKKEKDYKAIGNTLLTIPPGTLSTTITVPVYNDGKAENNEYFYVNLTRPTNCILGDVTGVVTILDGAPATSSARSIKVMVAEIKLSENFNVTAYPNPSNNHFSMKVGSADSRAKITLQVYDVNGRLVETRNNVNPNIIIQLGDSYKTGVYLIRVMQGKEHKEIKLVKL